MSTANRPPEKRKKLRTGPQQGQALREIKLRWWAFSFPPIVLAIYAGSVGWLPVPFVALALFCLVFWIMSGIVAVIMLARRKKPEEPRQ